MDEEYLDGQSEYGDEQEAADAVITQPLSPMQNVESPEIGIIRELSPYKALESLEYELKGYAYNPQKKKWEKKGESLMSDEGVNKILRIIRISVSQLVTFSNFDRDQVKKQVIHISKDAYHTIALKWKSFGIKSKSDINTIQKMVSESCFAAYSQAIGGGNRNVVRQAVQESIGSRTEFSQPMQPQQPVEKQKRSLFGFGR